jgi:NADH-quinone oxidoreductase subunit C
MALTNEHIKARLAEKFGEQISNFEEPYGMLTFEAPKDLNLKVLNFLYDDEELKFRFMTDLCGVHFPDQKEKELAVVYHLHNMIDNVRIRFKVFADINQPDIYTATGLFSAANWMERETYDFYGINFVGHPNLKRILNVEEMDYFPMRKEYPLEDRQGLTRMMRCLGGKASLPSDPSTSSGGFLDSDNGKVLIDIEIDILQMLFSPEGAIYQ